MRRERVHIFGDERHLIGIYTEPVSAPGTTTDAPTVVYLNAGLLHRVGPYRLHVDLARELAAVGFPGFRFDMTGLGDSAVTPGGLSGDERFAADVSNALDFLASEHGARRFILLGLCSGADFAHVGAVRDDRVVGAVLLDGYGYPTRGFYLRYYAPRLANPRRLARFLARETRRRLRSGPTADAEPVDVFGREFPPRERVAADLAKLLERGVKLYFVYTGGQPYFNYRGQFADMFPGLDPGDAVRVDHLPRIDHTYTLLDDRNQLERDIRAWLRKEFPPVTVAAPPADPRPADTHVEPHQEDTPGAPDDETETFVF